MDGAGGEGFGRGGNVVAVGDGSSEEDEDSWDGREASGKMYDRLPYLFTPTMIRAIFIHPPPFASKSLSLTCPPHRPSHVPAPYYHAENNHLEEEPFPATALLLPVELLPPSRSASGVPVAGGTPCLLGVLVDVLVLCFDGDDIVVIRELARLR